MTLAGSHIHEDVAPVGNRHNSDVRSTGGEGFLTPLGRGDAQDGRDDVGVGHGGEHQRRQEDERRQEEAYPLKQMSVYAGRLQQRGDVTEEVIDLLLAEGQPGQQNNRAEHREEGPHPAAQNQQETHPAVHDDGVAQGVTDGHIAVEGHHHQQDELHCPQEEEEVCLADAACKRYGLPVLEEKG